MADHPNFLMIMADQLTALALGCYGNSVVKTPNIDRLAKRGVVFENCYNNISICAPSRASMCSGILPSKLMHFDNGTEFPSRYPTFMHHLRHGGYEVVLSGKMHFVGADQSHGFERRLTTDIGHWSRSVHLADMTPIKGNLIGPGFCVLRLRIRTTRRL